MTFQKLMLTIVGFATGISMLGCASTSSVKSSSAPATPEAVIAPTQQTTLVKASTDSVPHANNNLLICKAKKSRFHYDWDATSLSAGQADQNSIRYEFRQASRPAGDKGENLKVGECGWAGEALSASKKTKSSSQVTFKSLSDEITQNFYKLKTGKVFKVPVRQTKNGLMAAPGSGVNVVR